MNFITNLLLILEAFNWKVFAMISDILHDHKTNPDAKTSFLNCAKNLTTLLFFILILTRLNQLFRYFSSHVCVLYLYVEVFNII